MCVWRREGVVLVGIYANQHGTGYSASAYSYTFLSSCCWINIRVLHRNTNTCQDLWQMIFPAVCQQLTGSYHEVHFIIMSVLHVFQSLLFIFFITKDYKSRLKIIFLPKYIDFFLKKTLIYYSKYFATEINRMLKNENGFNVLL